MLADQTRREGNRLIRAIRIIGKISTSVQVPVLKPCAISRVRRIVFAFAAVITFVSLEGGSVSSLDNNKISLSAEEAARLVAEVPKIRELQLSPDGTAVVYAVTTASVETNARETTLLLERLDATAASSQVPVRLDHWISDDEAVHLRPRWCPDATCITYFTTSAEGGPAANHTVKPPRGETPVLVRYQLSSRQTSPIPLHDTSPLVSTSDATHVDRPRVRTVGRDYVWSPKGRFLAFTAVSARGAKLDPRRGVLTSPQSHAIGEARPTMGLFVLDVASGRLELVTPDRLHVVKFDWSPDENALVIAAASDPNGVPAYRTDIYLIERNNRKVRPLVTQAGLDGNPAWSPDGKWIAFSSHFGDPIYSGGWPAVVPTAGGPAVRLATKDDPRVSINEQFFWRADSQGFYYSSGRHMTNQLMYTDCGAQRTVSVAKNDDVFDTFFSFDARRRRVAFRRDWLTTPPQLYVQDLASGESRQITRLSPGFPLSHLVRVDRVRWPSRDGQFMVHGLLLTPRAAWRSDAPGSQIAVPLPTLVFLQGGPGMVQASFDRDGYNGALLPLAARGYAVFYPNTRGRDGYGEAFRRGMRDGKSAGRLPFEDMMSGIDYLVRNGVSNAEQLGVFGHSYGGYLTSYATTQTDRFKAAVVHEGAFFEWVTRAISIGPGTDMELLMRDLYGVGDPFQRDEWARLVAESPGFNMERVSTPTLLQFGSGELGKRTGHPLFMALQRLKVPSELAIYDEGHVFVRPSAVADDITRTSAWFDYWVRGLPYPDAARALVYDKWRASRSSAHGARQ